MAVELYKKLIEYSNTDIYPFHMPGHKRKKIDRAIGDQYRADITEVEGFDNLHHPTGIIQEIQRDAAELYGASETYLLINGSTCGILSAVAAAVPRGGHLLAARNCHKCVYHAAQLRDLQVSYLFPAIDEELMICDAIQSGEVEAELRKKPDVSAVVITSPTYEGLVSDIRKISEVVHRFGKILIVDEAHGAHFGFHKEYPENAVTQGADIVIHSLHKTLPALTQTALLHVLGNLVDREDLRRYLQIFQSSSPSYLLMSSIDSCLGFLRKKGGQRLDRLLEYRREFDDQMSDCSCIKIFGNASQKDWRMKASDPGKIVITSNKSQWSGKQLIDCLRSDYMLEMEMAGYDYVLGIVTVMDRGEGFQRLRLALSGIDNCLSKNENRKYAISFEIRPTVILSMSDAAERKRISVSLSEAAGRTAAGFVSLYPPGIPLIVPGERFDDESIDLIHSCLNIGLNVQGIGSDRYISVVYEKGD